MLVYARNFMKEEKDMYYYINGEYVEKGENFIVIDAGGVGYKIYTSLVTIVGMPEFGKKVKVFTHFYVREDTQDLYGFPTNEELSMFLNLISVSGVGPKAALAILSIATPLELALAIIQKNVKVITKASGVGPKLAERVILELKNKIKNVDALSEEFAEDIVSDSGSEAVQALVALGYSEQESKKAVGLSGDNLSVEETIREALKNLMK